MESFAWMAWTWQTAAFFTGIVAMFVFMTIWERVSPSGERHGVLGITTTRGDRLFISLLGARVHTPRLARLHDGRSVVGFDHLGRLRARGLPLGLRREKEFRAASVRADG